MILYSYKTCMNKNAQDQWIEWERKALRRILGGNKVDDLYLRASDDLYKLYNTKYIIEIVRKRIL